MFTTARNLLPDTMSSDMFTLRVFSLSLGQPTILALAPLSLSLSDK